MHVQRRDIAFLSGLCLLAAVRVFLFAAAFPVFDNVDEQAHFDLVFKYSRGRVPDKMMPFEREAGRLIAAYGSPEYLRLPGQFRGGRFPPPRWTAPADETGRYIEKVGALWAGRENSESAQPPVYYAVAGLWYDLGRLLGLGVGAGIYWIRFLDVPIYALLVWLSYFFAARFFPARPWLRLAVPCLLAVFPQDVFYSINNDVPSALLVGAAFYGLLSIRSERRGLAFHGATGLLIAAAFLTKFTNVAALLLPVIILPSHVLRLWREGRFIKELPKLSALSLAAGVPICGWLIRNWLVFHDVTGQAGKAAVLGWTPKPLGQWLRHPIFSPGGAFFFWKETMRRFWTGELVWHMTGLSWPGMSALYWTSSAVFLSACLMAVVGGKKATNAGERFVVAASLLSFFASLAFLAAISLAYDFGDCWYPSAKLPYVTSGRLLSGALLPFAACYLIGADVVLTKLEIKLDRLLMTEVFSVLLLVVELAIRSPAFASAYNWFHL